jgi:hypothetical protein
MSSRLTLAQIDDMLARDEAQLKVYRCAAAEAEADGLDPTHAHGLARFVEERIGVLRRARAIRLARRLAGPARQQPAHEHRTFSLASRDAMPAQ